MRILSIIVVIMISSLSVIAQEDEALDDILLRSLSNGNINSSCSYKLVRGISEEPEDKFEFTILRIKLSKSLQSKNIDVDQINFLILSAPVISETISPSGQTVYKAVFEGTDSALKITEIEILFDKSAEILSLNGKNQITNGSSSKSLEDIFNCN